ncbi:hypothetical protein ACFLVN_03260 [Chloroflexota bacterium]
MRVDQGFKTRDNIITINSCTSMDSIFSVGQDTVGVATAEEILDKLATRVVDIQMYLFRIGYRGPKVRPQILLNPCVAEAIDKDGYTKSKMKQYLHEHTTFSANRFEQLSAGCESLCDAVQEGLLPKKYRESADPSRLVSIVWSLYDFLIAVSGDPDRDNCFVCTKNGYIDYPISKIIELPENWQELLREFATK